MPILSNAPLIEAIFELRWAEIRRTPTEVHFDFPPEEIELLPGQFRSEMKQSGFDFYERLNPESPALPHVVTHRFRKKAEVWPCYQLGLGIFTANQINQNYGWSSYKQTIIDGIHALGNAHPKGLIDLPTLGVELRYRDGFIFDEGETAPEFLEKKLSIGFSEKPVALLETTKIQNDIIFNQISFSVRAIEPRGTLTIIGAQGFINGRPGFILDTAIRSADNDKPALTPDGISTWLEQAHVLQKHAFETLINPDLQRSFK